MPPEMAVSMRHTKIKAEEAALLAGELNKPTWESKNEGIHERVSFEDSIWGFDLAGGIYYQTPLRVTRVKPDSRAEKAGIRPGDKLLRINDIDTSTLTIQQAHTIIIESGIHIRLSVTAPEDEEDAYFCYEDPFKAENDAEQERLREEEKARKRQVHARVSSYWSLQWPWVSKRRVIYRESNCFMVPSKFEDKNRERFPVQPMIRTQDDIVLDAVSKQKNRKQHTITATDKVSDDEISKTRDIVVNGNSNVEINNEHSQSNSVKEEDDEKSINNLENTPNYIVNEVEEEVNNEVSTAANDLQSDVAFEEIKNDESSLMNGTDDEILKTVLNDSGDMDKADEDRILDSIINENENSINGDIAPER